jgi:hypothetical protein
VAAFEGLAIVPHMLEASSARSVSAVRVSFLARRSKYSSTLTMAVNGTVTICAIAVKIQLTNPGGRAYGLTALIDLSRQPWVGDGADPRRRDLRQTRLRRQRRPDQPLLGWSGEGTVGSIRIKPWQTLEPPQARPCYRRATQVETDAQGGPLAPTTRTPCEQSPLSTTPRGAA